jgi:hypothetical protein
LDRIIFRGAQISTPPVDFVANCAPQTPQFFDNFRFPTLTNGALAILMTKRQTVDRILLSRLRLSACQKF